MSSGGQDRTVSTLSAQLHLQHLGGDCAARARHRYFAYARSIDADERVAADCFKYRVGLKSFR